jgi:pyruvate dehydrogenase E1 component alpha subunit
VRSPNFNVQLNIAKQFSPEISLNIFERMCMVRYFEQCVINAVKKKEITYPVYLSSGQEAVAAALSIEIRDYAIFAQHRAHDIYLTFGGPPDKLKDELMGLPTGTSKGRAGSNCLQYHENGISMFGHHGFIGENVPQAVGAALGSGLNTVCIFGDGAAEEDYIFPSMGFAASKKLPVLFVCIDNNLSILTKIEERRNWNITDIAKSFGIPAIDISDNPWALLEQIKNLTKTLPAFINCYVCRGYWHVGVGIDGVPEWDRFKMVKDELISLGHAKKVREIESRQHSRMVELWGVEPSLRPLKK